MGVNIWMSPKANRYLYSAFTDFFTAVTEKYKSLV
ncbi:hypothetical protein SAMN05660206_111105 [Sphingobacterium wenxiniae]|uniref:Uncharacterized protein n=1 Tax=Sphingobacterium wenxiniae TaxID=683125 RepID=A0A1I6V632_9SPHI|nr:hypothetical protein SAMN05660206_111105 [Sphingobacterium wenxiniae]